MNISTNQNQTAFSAKFINNKAFQEVVQYAKKTNQLQELDTALNKLNNANTGDILLIHGTVPGGVYSNFNLGGRHAVQNLGAETPAKASFNGILELAELGRKFKKLFGREVKSNIKTDDIIKKYSV